MCDKMNANQVSYNNFSLIKNVITIGLWLTVNHGIEALINNRNDSKQKREK